MQKCEGWKGDRTIPKGQCRKAYWTYLDVDRNVKASLELGVTGAFKNNMKACMLVASTSTRSRDRIAYLHFDSVASNVVCIFFNKSVRYGLDRRNSRWDENLLNTPNG